MGDSNQEGLREGGSEAGRTTNASAQPPLVLCRDPSEPGIELPPFLITYPDTSIGREQAGTSGGLLSDRLSVPDSSVSREHARITWEHNTYVIHDLGSTNGTFVNGFRVDAFPIKHGDQLLVGKVAFLAQPYNPKAGTATTEDRHNITRVQPVTGAKTQSGDRTTARLNAASCGFGAIAIRGYEAATAELSDMGAARLDMAISRCIAAQISQQVYAARRPHAADLRIDLLIVEGADPSQVTQKLASALEKTLRANERSGLCVDWAISAIDPAEAERRLYKHREITSIPRRELGAKQKAATELRWLHISDLHFGAGTTSWRYDHSQVMSALQRDLQRSPFAADRIFITGDIAFSGAAAQYDAAFGSIQALALAGQCDLAGVRIVPGNHDIDRRTADTPLLRALHHYARASQTALDDLLADTASREVLLRTSVEFRKFVQRFAGHPKELDWHEPLSMGNSRVEIWGLNSTWCSDADDGRGDNGAFDPNLVVARAQYQDRTKQPSSAAVHLLLTHHPLDWTSTPHGRWLRSAFASAPLVHLSGHIHHHSGTRKIELGKANNYYSLAAGAAHSEEKEISEHSYSRCLLRCEANGQWTLAWSPRVYDSERDEFRPDSKLDLDQGGFTWCPLPTATSAVSGAELTTAALPAPARGRRAGARARRRKS
ncbi:MAG TPA: FHA domain-containing protein [Kofleriaceae bacterium]|nr:FHA domain-containing protein [Kofleriaceae bacterium]